MPQAYPTGGPVRRGSQPASNPPTPANDNYPGGPRRVRVPLQAANDNVRLPGRPTRRLGRSALRAAGLLGVGVAIYEIWENWPEAGLINAATYDMTGYTIECYSQGGGFPDWLTVDTCPINLIHQYPQERIKTTGTKPLYYTFWKQNPADPVNPNGDPWFYAARTYKRIGSSAQTPYISLQPGTAFIPPGLPVPDPWLNPPQSPMNIPYPPAVRPSPRPRPRPEPDPGYVERPVTNPSPQPQPEPGIITAPAPWPIIDPVPVSRPNPNPNPNPGGVLDPLPFSTTGRSPGVEYMERPQPIPLQARQPARKREKEIKARSRIEGVVESIMDVYGDATEVGDVVTAMYWALSEDCRNNDKARGHDHFGDWGRAQALYRLIDKPGCFDLNQALLNLASDQIQDRLIGLADRAAVRILGRGGAAGLRWLGRIQER